MGVSPIKRHRENGGYWSTISDVELDKAFGLNNKDELADGDLAYVQNKPDGPNVTGTGQLLARYVRYDDTTGVWQFFGSSWSAKSEDVEIVRKVTVIWA